MAKISTYAAGTATSTDTVIGTDTDNSDATKTFTMQSIADFAQVVGRGIVTNAGADFTLALTDANKYVRCTGTASSITIPLNSVVAFDIGTEIVLRPANAQANLRALPVSVAVTLNFYSPTAGAARVNLQDNLFLKKIATDEWDAWGNII